jgi:hypothetical protein
VIRVREPRRNRAEDPDVPSDGDADADAARSVHAGERTLLRLMRWTLAFSIVLAALATCTAYEVVDAANLLKPGSQSGYGPAGSTEFAIAALVAFVVGTIALGVAGSRTRLAPLVPLFAVAFVVARFYTFDPYYAPYLKRMSDGGLVAPGLIYILIVAAVVVAALMVKWPAAAPAGAALLVISALLALVEGAGH